MGLEVSLDGKAKFRIDHCGGPMENAFDDWERRNSGI